MLREFKAFILRGNVVDLAVGLVVGVAFGAVVTALVADFITPLIAAIFGKPSFGDLSFTINGSTFLYGHFINTLVSFFLVATAVFFFVVVPFTRLRQRMVGEEVDPSRGQDPTTKESAECTSEIPVAAKRCPQCTAQIGAAPSETDAMQKSPHDSWDETYRRDGRIWGEHPSELAALAVEVLGAEGIAGPRHAVLDVGCGYGRDALHLWRSLGVAVMGVDPSPAAVAAAREAAADAAREVARESLPAADPPEFVCAGYDDLDERRFPVVMCCNVLHLLDAAGRERLAAALVARVTPGGLLFLMTLSPSDPEHHGKGVPVAADPGSFVDRIFLHFCEGDELRGLFGGLSIERLEEHAYVESRPHGEHPHSHRHVSWRLVARRPPLQEDRRTP